MSTLKISETCKETSVADFRYRQTISLRLTVTLFHCNLDEKFKEQKLMSNEQKLTSNEQKVTSKKQKVTSNEQKFQPLHNKTTYIRPVETRGAGGAAAPPDFCPFTN